MDTQTIGSADGSDFEEQISDRTISRMRWYLYALEDLARRGVTTVASREIAEKVGVKPGLVRKDLCHFGGFGRPSVGYNVTYLQKKIREILRLNEEKKIAWIGCKCLLDDPTIVSRFGGRNCIIAAIFDSDPSQVGISIGDTVVRSTDELDETVRAQGIRAAVIGPSEKEAQATADKLAAGGIKAILNLGLSMVAVPEGVAVRNIDLPGELIMLSYHASDVL